MVPTDLREVIISACMFDFHYETHDKPVTYQVDGCDPDAMEPNALNACLFGFDSLGNNAAFHFDELIEADKNNELTFYQLKKNLA